MFNDKISDYIDGVAAKYLSAVDTKKSSSNQHEIGGLVDAGFQQYLGHGFQNFRYRVRQVYLSDDIEEPIICDGYVNWYNSRRHSPNRSPEYKLYYKDSIVTELMASGDFFLIAKLRNNFSRSSSPVESAADQLRPDSFLMIFTPAGSNVEYQLRNMFGLDNVQYNFKRGILDTVDFLLPLRSMLETLGVEVGAGISQEEYWLDELIREFGGKEFPKTSVFSEFARRSVAHEVLPTGALDSTLMTWMEREESLFKIYERHLVRSRLAEGFEEDVDAFIAFSLSVQNRRKSRAGHAFEGHLDRLFNLNGLSFEQGRGKGRVTENKSKPDFIFPSFDAYRNQSFPTRNLRMLGAKTTCKDRWRQVLSEAKRIDSKHLITLEAAISREQLEEMKSQKLQLVVPRPIHTTYPAYQRSNLMDVQDFIREVWRIQRG